MPARRVANSDDESATDYSDNGGKSQASGSKRKRASQAKGKGKRKNKNAEDAEELDEDAATDDDEPVSKGKKGPLSADERQELVGAFVRHVLFTETTRKSHSRTAMAAAVLTKPNHKGRFNELFPLAQRKLKDTFGMELVQMRAKESSSSKSTSVTYVLRSALPIELIREMTTIPDPAFATAGPDEDDIPQNPLARELAAYERDGAVYGEEQGATMRDTKKEEGGLYGVLGIILALILVNGQVIGDDQLVTYLRRLDLTPSGAVPSTIGSVQHEGMTLDKYLERLAAQGYIERGYTANAQRAPAAGRVAAAQRTIRGAGENRIEGGDPNIEYRWGSRAELEIGQKGVAQFIAGIWGEENTKENAEKYDKLQAEIRRAAGTTELKTTADDG